MSPSKQIPRSGSGCCAITHREQCISGNSNYDTHRNLLSCRDRLAAVQSGARAGSEDGDGGAGREASVGGQAVEIGPQGRGGIVHGGLAVECQYSSGICWAIGRLGRRGGAFNTGLLNEGSDSRGQLAGTDGGRARWARDSRHHGQGLGVGVEGG